MVGEGLLDSEVSAIDVAWRSGQSGLAGCLPRSLVDKGLAEECLAERECLADECLRGGLGRLGEVGGFGRLGRVNYHDF